jgi:septum formation protein
MQSTMPRPLILGSTSSYRRELLQRLQLPFCVVAPQVDESPLPNELPLALATRLALAKAQAVAKAFPDSVVIGSDQVADLHGVPLGKPGDHDNAVRQLRQMRGNTVVFHTAVAVVCSSTAFVAEAVVPVRVTFRNLSDAEIDYYLHTERPYDCAGSAKSEGLGIALLERIENTDPTALIGLPLIQTSAMLRAAGLDVLRPPT